MSARTEVTGPARPLVPALGGVYAALAPAAEALLRATVGLLLVPHGAQKLFGWFGGNGLAGTGEFFASIGYVPGMFWATLVALLEFFGGLMLAAGLLTRPVAAAVVVFMAMAVSFHLPAWFWNQGGAEMPLLWGMAALFFAIRGGGRYSVDAAIGREL